MATVYFTKPITSDLRADVLQYIRDAINSQARMFEGDTLVSPPVNAVRYVAANNRFEKWSGSVWDPLNITGNVTPTPPGGSLDYVQFNAGGGNFGGHVGFQYNAGGEYVTVGSGGAGQTKMRIYPGLGVSVFPNAATGGWARGFLAMKESDAARLGGAGWLGGNESVTLWRVGFGSDWWDASSTPGLTVIQRKAALGSFSPSETSSSYGSFEVGSAGNGLLSSNTTQQIILTANLWWNGANWVYGKTSGAAYIQLGGDGSWLFYNAASGTAGTVPTMRERVTIQSDGLVRSVGPGAGFTFASRDDDGQDFSWLTSDGDVARLYHSSAGDLFEVGKTKIATYKSLRARLDNPSDYSNANIELYSTAGDTALGFHNAGAKACSLVFRRSTGRLQILGNPWSAWIGVDMTGDIATSGSVSAYGAASFKGSKNGWSGLSFYDSSNAFCNTLMARSSDGYGGIYNKAESNWLLQWDGSGNFTATGNVTAYSDERLKANFAPAYLSLDQMAWLQAEEFTRTDTGLRQVGVRAQALRQIIPLAVQEDEGGMLSVDYGKAALVTVLNLAREVATLKAQMEAS